MDDLLQCPVCFDNFDQNDHSPRQLNNCQHILCSKCLPYLIKQPPGQRQFIECPICKDKLYAPLNQIPKSLIIIQLIEATKSTSNTASAASNNRISYSSSNTNRNETKNNNPVYNPNQNYAPPYPVSTIVNRQMSTPSQQQQASQDFFKLPKIESDFHPSNPFYSAYQQNTQSSQNIEPWDTQRFLRNLFNEMDTNRDGSITAHELQEALRRGQGTTDFNLKTIQLLISRYDKNGDREISFDEFFDLYCNLNDEFENFLMIDEDGSGFIDLDEFSSAMNTKGYNFSRKFFKLIVDEISKYTHSQGIHFDNFIRAMARFDYLIEYYKKTPYFHNKHNMESYLKNTFFQDFW